MSTDLTIVDDLNIVEILKSHMPWVKEFYVEYFCCLVITTKSIFYNWCTSLTIVDNNLVKFDFIPVLEGYKYKRIYYLYTNYIFNETSNIDKLNNEQVTYLMRKET